MPTANIRSVNFIHSFFILLISATNIVGRCFKNFSRREWGVLSLLGSNTERSYRHVKRQSLLTRCISGRNGYGRSKTLFGKVSAERSGKCGYLGQMGSQKEHSGRGITLLTICFTCFYSCITVIFIIVCFGCEITITRKGYFPLKLINKCNYFGCWQIHFQVEYALKYPWHRNLPRLEARSYIEHYGPDDVWLGKTMYM